MTNFVIFSDSKSVLEAIFSQESKNALVSDTLQSIYKLNRKGKLIEFCWVPSHVGIPGNEEADTKAKAALGNDIIIHYQVPFTDKFPQIKDYVNLCWQQFWNDNNNQKLYEIMPVVRDFNVNCLTRKEQVVIHRIRIGHTRLTHSFRMEGRPSAPMCDFCNQELTVKHFMLYCRRFSLVRSRFYTVNSMRELFETVSLRKILTFLKQSGLYTLL